MRTRTTDVFFLEAPRKTLRMETYAEQGLAVSTITLGRSQDWVHHVINLLDAAMHQLYRKEKTARGTILKAASLLRNQIEVAQVARETRGGLRPWQARKVRAYIDSHIARPVLVADLCALIQLSESHFSRAFSRTFGKSPHAFLIGRRVELAAQYMLQTEAPLSDIALRSGFTDQPHLCKHFRQITGHTPAAWRRAHSSEDDGERHRSPPRSLQEHMQTECYSVDGMPRPNA
jgi:AraC family transcriptional regulator